MKLATAFVFLAACGGSLTQSQIEMKGKDADLAALAGDWQGGYQQLENGRTGSIKFSLELGRHTADGQVLMGPAATPLKVSFVKIKESTVTGKIEPYIDPACMCQVSTEFLGTVAGNEIDGTFTEKVIANGDEMHGTWKVSRGAADGT